MHPTPSDPVEWAIAVAIGRAIAGGTGVEDWLTKLFTQCPARSDLERTVTDLEKRMAALERANANIVS